MPPSSRIFLRSSSSGRKSAKSERNLRPKSESGFCVIRKDS